ncbi:hypothetical protein [Marinicella sp. W31]|uniref:hypothetical protein n=1 Tax=Marinicella sp. W31 TaxID=3023713 RepID=UPI0037581558
MKKVFFLSVLIISATAGYFLLKQKDDLFVSDASQKNQSVAPHVADKNDETESRNKDDLSQDDKLRGHLQIVYFEDYSDEARMIDKQYRNAIQDAFPIVPTFDLAQEFSTQEEISDYLEKFISDVENYPREASEIAALCSNISNAIRVAQQRNDSSLLTYYNTLKDKCQLIRGENDVFFILEEMAKKGNSMERLFYIDSLNQAIHRKVIKPLVNPIGYMERRDMGVSWLHQLAAKGVIGAAEQLSVMYRSNYNLEANYVLSYFYAAQVYRDSRGDTDFNARHLDALRERLTDVEIKRLERMSDGRLPY